MTSLLKNTQKLFDILAALLVLSLPFSLALPNIILIVLTLLLFVNHKNIRKPYFLPFYIFAAAALFIGALAISGNYFYSEIRTYTKYFLICYLFFLYSQVRNKSYAEHALILGCFLAVVFSGFAIAQHVWIHPDFIMSNGSIVNDLLILKRPYIAFMIVLTIFTCLKNGENSSKRLIYYSLAIFFFLFSIYIAARLSVGLNCLLFFVYLFRTKHLRQKTKVGIALALCLVLTVIFSTSENLKSRINLRENIQKTFTSIEKSEPRVLIWECSVKIIDEQMNWLTGFKSYDLIRDKLSDCYAQSIDNEQKRAYYVRSSFKPHNQFLDFLMLGGLVPCFLLIGMFITAFFSKSTFELKLLFFLFFSLFFIESLLHRQFIAYIFGIFTALYSPKKRPES